MGQLVLIVLHLCALLWLPAALLLTIPLHLIYSAVRRNATPKPTSATHVRCPDCRELVLRDARKCKHCGCALLPQ